MQQIIAQQALFEDSSAPATWTGSDDWETPDWLAKTLAGRARKRTLEPAAGTGQIAQYLPERSVCVEINSHRTAIGRDRAGHCIWYSGDLLSPAMMGAIGRFDTIVANPPFSVGMDFIVACADLLNPDGLAHFLLPSSFFQTIGRGMRMHRLSQNHGLTIIAKTELVGRVAYLRNGKRVSGRQRDDAIFTLGFGPAAIDFLFAE